MKFLRLFALIIIVLSLFDLRPVTAGVGMDDEIPDSGQGWSKLEPDVDKLVRDLIKKKKLPGMSVAVVKDDRLIYAKGFGAANTKEKKAMKESMRIRIGSVTKATVTGPAAWKMMNSLTRRIDPEKKTLYGPKGVFGNRFSYEISVGIKRHTPIVSMAIDADNHVHTWYTNGVVTKGTSTDLDALGASQKYTLPAGKKPVDIRAIAISKNNRVHVWYDDRSHSVGTTTDLDSITKPDPDNRVSLPKGKDMEHIVGIGINKTTNDVFVWYDNGTVSSGTSGDFDKHFGPKPFTTANISGGNSYEIRGMDISVNNNVYAWFSSGNVSSGTVTKLNQYKEPHPYSMRILRKGADPIDWEAWYSAISLQDLLNHTSGFTAADSDAAAEFFKTTSDRLTYNQAHRHFLMTRKLLFAPGTGESYSNHGFGLWTLLFPEISGMSYQNYAQNRYLKSMGLDDDILPARRKPDYRDASSHDRDSKGNPVPVDFEASSRGLAAGGYMASAKDLVRLMVELEKKYTWTELANMGWNGGGNNALHHSGLIDGGTAFVTMFPKGYKSSSTGADIGRVKVVVITNIRTSSSELVTLANKIAVEVPAANVNSGYDIWKGKPVNPSKPKP